MSVFVKSPNKSKKALKRKRTCDGDVFSEGDETQGNLRESFEIQTLPSPTRKKKKKVHGEVRQHAQEVVCSRSKRGKIVENGSTMSSQQESEEDRSDGNMLTKENLPELKKGDTSWSQKSSWKSLVGESGRVAFSLQSVLSGNENFSEASMKWPVTAEGCFSMCTEGSSFSPSQIHPIESNKGSTVICVSQSRCAPKNFESQDRSGPCIELSVGTKLAAEDCLKVNKVCDQQELVAQNALKSTHENVCTFMRSENYEQEWLAARQAAKEVFKSTRKDALKSMKIFHKRSTM